MATKLTAIIGAALVAIGVAVVFWPMPIPDENWTPMGARVDMKAGEVVDQTFETDRTGTYWVMLRVWREGVEFEEMEAALGASWWSSTDDKGPILAPWTIESDGEPWATGSGQGSQGRCYSSADDIGVSLGSFEGEKGRKFRIRAEVKRTMEPLRKVRTDLLVRADPMYFKNALVGAAIRRFRIGLFWLILPGGSLLLVAAAVTLVGRKRRKGKHAGPLGVLR